MTTGGERRGDYHCDVQRNLDSCDVSINETIYINRAHLKIENRVKMHSHQTSLKTDFFKNVDFTVPMMATGGGGFE